jgi:hypothetical protein
MIKKLNSESHKLMLRLNLPPDLLYDIGGIACSIEPIKWSATVM